MLNFFKLVLVAGLLTPYLANAIPLPKGARAEIQKPATLTDQYDFEGIVALDDCSGSIIRFENSKDTDNAMVLTNGHCFEGGMPNPGQVFSHVDSSRSFTVLDPSGQELGEINATEVIFSLMTKTDITLYKLQQTYADILSQFNVRPYTLSSQHPQLNQPIEVISGYWKAGYSCSTEFFVHELDEANWSMFDSIRYSRPGCEVIGGTSGSPVIAQGTRTVIAINNTINEDGDRCTMDNPCEIDAAGNVTYVKGYGYAQETYLIYSCLDAQNQVDLTVPGCQLPH